MKQFLLSFAATLFVCSAAFSQSPQTVPYQAVARDAAGNLLQNQTVCVQFTVHKLTATGAVEYQEHQAATTNKLGLFNVSIGAGIIDQFTFAGINWAGGAKFMEVGINTSGTCGGYTSMGASQMASVPYALFAGSSAGSAGGDLAGNYPNPTVIAIQGQPVVSTTPTPNQVLEFTSGSWTPTTLPGSFTGFAVPANKIGIAATAAGAATTAIRSDATFTIDQTITPTWSGLHTFTGGLTETGAASINGGSSATGTTIGNASSATTVGGTLGVTGAAVLSSTENVAGLVTQTGGLTSNGTVNINNSSTASATNIGTGAAVETVDLGSSTTTSSTTINSGTGGVNINSGTGGVNINGATSPVTIANLASSSNANPVYATTAGKLIVGTQGTPVTQSGSGNITNNAGTCTTNTNTLTIAGAATVVSLASQVSVTVSTTGTTASKLAIFLTAPNGNILNLVNTTSQTGTALTNTVFSDGGANGFPTGGSAPYTATFKPDGGSAAICSTTPTSGVTTFATLSPGGTYNPNGAWTLTVLNNINGGVGTFTWSLTIAGSTGITNYVPKWTAAGSLSNTSDIYDGSGAVGINQTAPAAQLQITSPYTNAIEWQEILNNPFNNGPPTFGYGAGIILGNSSPVSGSGAEPNKWVGIAGVASANSGDFSNETDMVFYTNNFNGTTTTAPTERMRILGGATGNAGNVGIGTSAPATILDILSGNNWSLNTGNGDMRIGATVSSIPYYLKLGIATAGGGAGDAYIASTGGGSSRLYLGTAIPSQTSGVGYTQTMALQGGNVGIGAISPLTNLEILATSPELRILENTGTNLAQIELGDGVNDPSNTVEGLRMIYNSSTGNSFLENIYASGTLNFQTNGANTRMTIDQNGKVGIGTASPGYLFHVSPTAVTTNVSMMQMPANTGVGTGYTYNTSISSVIGYIPQSTRTTNASSYQFGVVGQKDVGYAGAHYYDFNSGGVLGMLNYADATAGPWAWGALGYMDNNYNAYGGYFVGTTTSSAYNLGSYGVYASATTTNSVPCYGIYATASGGSSNWAGYFSGNVGITSLTAGLPVYATTGGLLTTTSPTTGQLGYWTRTGTDLYNTNQTDFVGIGTSTPNADLSFGSGINTNKIYLYDGAPGTVAAKYGFGIASGTMQVYMGDDLTTNKISFGNYDGTTFNELLRLQNNGNVGIGTASTGPIGKLELDATDVAVYLANLGDGQTVGSFMGETYSAHQEGFYNNSGSAWNGIATGTKQTIFGYTPAGKIGSITNTYPGSPAFRNWIDDGSGNASVSKALAVGTTLAVTGTSTLTGNVGIGTANSFSKATILVANTDTISQLDNANTAGLTIAGSTNLCRLQMGVGGSTFAAYGSWIQSTYDNSSSSFGNEALVLNPLGGQVGVGLSLPTQAMDIEGVNAAPANTGTTSSAIVRIENSTGNGNVLDIGNYAASPWGSWIQATDRTALSTITYPIVLQPYGGGVGIGTPSPKVPLDVETVGTLASTFAGDYIGNGANTTVATAGSGEASNVSIYAAGWIEGKIGVLAGSDARIKQVVGITNNAQDLETLSKIKITNYKYIDKVEHGDRLFKKVIAQQVQEVYPVAVHEDFSANYIPNIYQKATDISITGNLVTVCLDKPLMNNKDIKQGSSCKFYISGNGISGDGKQITGTIECMDANTLTLQITDPLESGEYAGAFVYGTAVNDFLTVDYDALSTLNVSATQELARKVTALEKDNESLKNTCAKLDEQNCDLTEKLGAVTSNTTDIQLMQKKLDYLQQLMEKNGIRSEK